MHNPQADHNIAVFSEQENSFSLVDDWSDFESDPAIAVIEPGPEITELDIAFACVSLKDDQREQWRDTLTHVMRETTKYSDNRISELVERIVNAGARFRDLTARLKPAPVEVERDPWRNTNQSCALARWAQALGGDWSRFPAAIFDKKVSGVPAISHAKQNAKFKRYRENNAPNVKAYETNRADANRQRAAEWKKINPTKVLLQKKLARGVLYNDRPFVTVDSEGANKKGEDRFHGDVLFPQHVSFLWGAGFERDKTHWLKSEAGEQLSPSTIIDWLLDLPRRFGDANFIAFAFSYDVGQILRGLPRKKAWEIARNKTFPEKGKLPRPVKAATLWRGYAIRYRKGKKFEVWRLRDPEKPYTLNAKNKKVLDTTDYIAINDVFSFYQTGLVKVVDSVRKQGHVSDTDFQLLKRNKDRRVKFDIDQIFPSYARSEPRVAALKRYCALELELTALAVRQLRSGFESIELRLKEWTGPGCAAAALLKKEGVFEHYPKDIATKDIPPWQEAAHHSFFGANIQLCKQGYAPDVRLFGRDVVSAYPSIMEKLPSMKDGIWRNVKRFANNGHVNHAAIADGNILNMYLVQWRFPLCKKRSKKRRGEQEDYIPFFPLPYRRRDKAIIFPARGLGWHTRDDIKAALEWIERFIDLGYFNRSEINFTIKEAWLFHSMATVVEAYATKNFQSLDMPSSDKDMERPFAFVRHYFDRRREIKRDIVKEAKYNIAELVIKLVINSLYGKTAQRIGGANGKPPTCANPYYAAAITAGTRLQLMRAALLDPSAVVMFATDGLITDRKLEGLPRAFPKDDPRLDLGDWECVDNLRGGIFLQSGVYSVLAGETKKDAKGDEIIEWADITKLRGMDKRNLTVGMPMRQFLLQYVLPAWRKPSDPRDKSTWPAVPVALRRYSTPGQAVATARSWDNTAGRWSEPISRMTRVHNIGVKRVFVPDRDDLYYSRIDENGTLIEAARCHSLVPTIPAYNATPDVLSAPLYPDWLETRAVEAITEGVGDAALDAMRPDIRANEEARRELTSANAAEEIEDFPDFGDAVGAGGGDSGGGDSDNFSPREFTPEFIEELLRDYDEAENVAAN